MPEINNIRGVYNVNTKRTHDKLTFEVGESFLAKIVSLGDFGDEILLKLLDGWKFPAKFKTPLEFIPEGFAKFEVEGFEDGKLIIKLIQEQISNKVNGDIIEEFLQNNNMNLTEKDYGILNSMAKHGIPLTKENISYIKTLTNFMDKFKNLENANDFIYKYLSSKGISIDSNQGKYIQGVLKDFFQSLNKLELGDILTLYENNLDISKENIDSFINVFKNSSSIFNGLKNLEKNLNNLNKDNTESVVSTEYLTSLEAKRDNMDSEMGNEVIRDIAVKENTKEGNKENIERNNGENMKSSGKENIKVNDGESIKSNNGKGIESASAESVKSNNGESIESTGEGSIKSNNGKSIESTSEESIKSNNGESIKSNSEENIKVNNKEVLKAENNSYKENPRVTVGEEVKNQLELRTNEMRNIIKDLMDNLLKPEMKNYDKVVDLIKNNINDFKMFNSLSNEYYYLDLPINLREDSYQCKLIIKDERKKGKVIDTKNVKIAASVKTINMGVVDAFIKVNNTIMDIEISCDKNWIKIIEKNKTKLLEMFSHNAYNIYVKVKEKKEDFNLSNCREFFGDTYLSRLNVKV